MLTKSNNTTYKGTLDNRYLIINEIDNGMTSKVYKVLDEQTSEIKIAKIYENDSAHAFKKEKKIFKIQALDISSNIKYYAAGTGDLEYDDNKKKNVLYLILLINIQYIKYKNIIYFIKNLYKINLMYFRIWK